MFKTLKSNNPQILLLRIIILAAAVIFIALAFNPLKHFYADVLASLRIQLLILSSVCALLLIVLKAYKLGIGLIIFCVIGLTPYLTNVFSAPPPSENFLTVKQINLNYSNKYVESHLARLKKQPWDILILQEFSDQNRDLLTPFLNTTHLFGYEEVEGIPYGIVVLSRIPMVYKQQVKLDADRFGYIKLKFLFNKNIITTFIAHPPSPRSKKHWQNRNILLKALKYAALEEQKNWLIAGDLNTVPWSEHFEWERDNTCYGMKRYSSFMPFEKGRSILTGLPIDHCIMSDNIYLSKLVVSDVEGSDHKMLSYDLNIN